jgi:SAM-dependent methyltransferase
LSDEHFIQYAKYYDALYADKDYAGESRYINDLLRGYLGDKSLSVLEFGSGTGKHAVELCELGNTILGVEPSTQMISLARDHPNFRLIEGDIREVGRLGEFDACIAMFHVLSYLSSSEDLELAFRNVEKNLASGGIFVFDVWHAPAVLEIGPEERTKRSSSQDLVVTRKATPTHHPLSQLVNVHYEIQVTDMYGNCEYFEENHLLKYLWPEEILKIASKVGFEFRYSIESFSKERPSSKTWSVLYVFAVA